jgi:hypothetical protein
MLISLAGRRIYYDLAGPENGPIVCFTHSLASDGGMWAEQLPPLLASGYRVLRLDTFPCRSALAITPSSLLIRFGSTSSRPFFVSLAGKVIASSVT